MSDIITFLTSEEIMMVYAIAFFSALLCFFIYIAQKTYDKRNKKHNTMELNRLVEKVSEKLEEEEKQSLSVCENVLMVEKEVEIAPCKVEEEKVVPIAIIPEVSVIDTLPEEKTATDVMLTEVAEVQEAMMPEKEVAEIQYESVEVAPEVAQRELEKLTEELKKAEDAPQNIELTEFEAEQEENAIISLDELLAKGNTLYEQNEITQYQDEGNEPITLQDLEERMKKFKEDFIEKTEVSKTEASVTENLDKKEEVHIMQTSLNLDANTPSEEKEVGKPYQAEHTFKSSPVISPIYGIEGKQSIHKQTELELENTATLKKFDDEIRKTNEFVMTLKELQKNLE